MYYCNRFSTFRDKMGEDDRKDYTTYPLCRKVDRIPAYGP